VKFDAGEGQRRSFGLIV